MYITGLELLLPSCSTVVLVVGGGGRGGIAGAPSGQVGRAGGGREASFSTVVLVASGTVAGD